MLIKVIDVSTTNIIQKAGNDWYNLYKKVKEAYDTLPEDEELIVDFERMNVAFGTETIFAANIIELPRVKCIFYNSPNVASAFEAIAMLAGKPRESVEHRHVEIVSNVKKPKSEKEKRREKERDTIDKFIRSQFVLNGIMRIRMNAFKNAEVTNISSLSRGTALRECLYENVENRINNGEKIDRLIVMFEKFPVAQFAKQNISDDAIKYAMLGVELCVVDENPEENRKLKLRTTIGARELPVDEKTKLLKNIQVGTVGVLTKFKKRKNKNIELRLEDEIVNQYIAIYTGINKETAEAKFKCFRFVDMESKWDAYAACGDEVDAPDVSLKAVKIEEMGIEKFCIGLVWHFNRFDGSVPGVTHWDTYTNYEGCYQSQREKVVLPEYIRRTLLSYGFEFDNEGLKRNVVQFESDLKQLENA